MNRAVRRGMNVLDARGPGHWYLLVNTDILDLSDAGCCVVGQVYGGRYVYGLFDLGLRQRGAGRYGFLPGARRVRAWTNVIADRKQRFYRSFPTTVFEGSIINGREPEFSR